MMALADCRKLSKKPTRNECRIYYCEECHAWHLTSKRLKEDRDNYFLSFFVFLEKNNNNG